MASQLAVRRLGCSGAGWSPHFVCSLNKAVSGAAVSGAIQSTHSVRRNVQDARINVAPGDDGLRPTSRLRDRGLTVVRMGVVANGRCDTVCCSTLAETPHGRQPDFCVHFQTLQHRWHVLRDHAPLAGMQVSSDN